MEGDAPIRVLIADDHPVIRVGLAQLFRETDGFEVAGLASDGEEAVGLAAELEPDVILMDAAMPGKDGITACREIRETQPAVRVLVFAASNEYAAVREAVAAGATGYLSKEGGMDRLLSAVRDVHAGELCVPPAVVARLFAEVHDDAAVRDPAASAGLTPREREILAAFARGGSYARIAETRGIKPVTVRNAIYGIQHKLNVLSMQELVLWAARNGLLDEEDPPA